jgi:hypothetical protein
LKNRLEHHRYQCEHRRASRQRMCLSPVLFKTRCGG